MISEKENIMRLYQHKMPQYLPIFGQGIQNLMIKGYYEMPKIIGEEGYDWFGVHWKFPAGEVAAMPGPDFMLDEISDWKTVVKFPDLDAFDWEKAIEIDKVNEFDRENNLLFLRLHNGLFERLHFLMGVENALCAMMMEPELVLELLDAMVDYKCKLVDKIAQYYKPDVICYHDDWGTQRSLFFSPDTWRLLFKERTAKIVRHVQSKGIKFELHSCGMIKDLIPEIVDDLKVDSLNIMCLNDIPALKKITENKVLYNVYLNTQKYDVMAGAGKLTEEILRQGVREELLSCAQGGCYLPCYLMLNPEWILIVNEEYEKCRREIHFQMDETLLEE